MAQICPIQSFGVSITAIIIPIIKGDISKLRKRNVLYCLFFLSADKATRCHTYGYRKRNIAIKKFSPPANVNKIKNRAYRPSICSVK
jgi:hypothetical protein